jgi:RNA polymerase sigma factor (sigma-70 family)
VRSLVVDEFRRSDVARRHLHRVVDGEVAPDRLLDEAVADSDQLTAALRRLAPRQREAVVLRYWEDLTETQTAQAMGCSVGAVKSNAAKGIAKLRAIPGLAEMVTSGGRK